MSAFYAALLFGHHKAVCKLELEMKWAFVKFEHSRIHGEGFLICDRWRPSPWLLNFKLREGSLPALLQTRPSCTRGWGRMIHRGGGWWGDISPAAATSHHHEYVTSPFILPYILTAACLLAGTQGTCPTQLLKYWDVDKISVRQGKYPKWIKWSQILAKLGKMVFYPNAPLLSRVSWLILRGIHSSLAASPSPPPAQSHSVLECNSGI